MFFCEKENVLRLAEVPQNHKILKIFTVKDARLKSKRKISKTVEKWSFKRDHNKENHSILKDNAQR